MSLKRFAQIIFITFFLIVLFFITYSNFIKKETKDELTENIKQEEEVYESNIIQDVNFITRDGDGNEY